MNAYCRCVCLWETAHVAFTELGSVCPKKTTSFTSFVLQSAFKTQPPPLSGSVLVKLSFVFLLSGNTCLTSACRCLSWTHCSRCLRCCSAARSNSCCFSWRNSSRSWTRVAMSTSLSHNSSTPIDDDDGHFIVLRLLTYFSKFCHLPFSPYVNYSTPAVCLAD